LVLIASCFQIVLAPFSLRLTLKLRYMAERWGTLSRQSTKWAPTLTRTTRKHEFNSEPKKKKKKITGSGICTRVGRDLVPNCRWEAVMLNYCTNPVLLTGLDPRYVSTHADMPSAAV